MFPYAVQLGVLLEWPCIVLFCVQRTFDGELLLNLQTRLATTVRRPALRRTYILEVLRLLRVDARA
jgi:hypothetical protein